jgi:hypothetical protein
MLAVSFLFVLICTLGFAQRQQDKQAGRDTVVRLAPARQLRKDVDLWPLITRPKNAAERRINATLNRLNGAFADRVRDCLSGEFAWSKDSFDSGEWQRTVKVTMRGPRFLSILAADGFYCGTAHPDDDLVVLVFDLETGEQVDWTALAPKSAGASQTKNVLWNEDGTPPLILQGLQAIYAAAEDPESDCAGYFQDERPFVLWPDAESGTLVAEVAGLPHVALPCKNELKLQIDQARKLGFDESLLQAIEEAHRIAASRQTAKPVRKPPAPVAATHPTPH